MRNRVIIGLGSNHKKEYNMAVANRMLRECFPNICFSAAIYTEPIEMENSESFLNQVAIASISQDKETVKSLCKQIEQQLGRTAEDKARGIVVIDIDLLQWNDEILKPSDLLRDYVQAALLVLSDARQNNVRSKQ